MNLEAQRSFCLSLPGTTEDVKWEDHLCFSVGTKIYCIGSMSEQFSCSLKVSDEDFVRLCERDSIIPAPYLARYKWVQISSESALSSKDWKSLIKSSYDLIFAKLSKRKQQGILAGGT